MRTLLGNGKLLGVPDNSLVADRELVTTLCAAAREDSSTVLSFHAGTETVCLCPFSIVWLKCTFWHSSCWVWASDRFALPYVQNSNEKPNL